MTNKEQEMLRNQIESTFRKLEESIVYLLEATQPIAPNCALGCLGRIEAIGDKSVDEARHLKVKQRLEKLGNALNRMDGGKMESVSAVRRRSLSVGCPGDHDLCFLCR